MEAVNSKMGNCALHALAKGIQWQYSLNLLDHLVEEEVEVETWRFLFRSCGSCGVVWKGCRMLARGCWRVIHIDIFRIDRFSMSQLLLHLLGLCDDLRVDVWSMTRAIRKWSTIMLGAHIMHIQLISMAFSANMAMDEWNTKCIIYAPWTIKLHVPFKTLVFSMFVPGQLGKIPRCMSRIRSCWQWLRKHVQPQGNGVSCYRNCLSWSIWVTRICNDLYGMSKLGKKYEAMIRNVFFPGWWVWGWVYHKRMVSNGQLYHWNLQDFLDFLMFLNGWSTNPP